MLTPARTTARRRSTTVIAAAVLTTIATSGAALASEGSDRTVFVPGVTVSETAAGTTGTFPLHTGRTEDGRAVDFVVLEASTSTAAQRWHVEVVDKLRNAGRHAVQPVAVSGGAIVFSGGVDFSPDRIVVGTPGTGFPPVSAAPGSVGDADYSPLVRLPDGSVLNAPQIGNASGLHDKVVSLDRARRTVTLRLSDGFAREDAVVYVSTDATAPDAAALEGATYAPRLDAAPSPGDDSSDSARASLAAFVNGPTGSPSTRQGINSALLGEGDPLNVLAWRPGQGRYSPLWDVHLTAWAPDARPRRITRFADVEDLAEDGLVTAPDGTRWGASRVIVNCPVIATG